MASEDEKWERYQNAPPEIRDLYSSKLANALNEELQKKYGVQRDKAFNYLDITGDVILGFRKIAELPYLLQTEVGLSQEAARQLTGELIDAWEPVVLREESESQQKKESVASLADKIAAIRPQVAVPAAAPEPATSAAPPVDFEPVKPMRTMQSDIDDKKPVHGYGALHLNETAAHDDDVPIIKATPFDELRPKQ